MRKLVILLALLVLAGMAAAQVQVRWFVGLGAGTDEPTIAAQQAIVDAYNASQNGIRLVLEIVANDQAYDVLATQFAAGNAPDIVGPVGIRGRAAFPGVWLDLSQLITAANYDLSDFDPALVDFYRIQGQGQIGLPFAVFPSYLAYNAALFDEASLPYPPARYGEPYTTVDGETVPWDIHALRDLAMLQTVDAAGRDATQADFDPNQIVQWGFGTMWSDIRGRLTLFGSGNFVDSAGNATIPDAWVEGVHWLYDGMWVDNFHPNGPYGGSALLGDSNWFESGNLAMAQTHLWYQACCMFALQDDWALAALPAGAGGIITAKLHADTFSIPATSRNPGAAFEVLSYLLSPEIAGPLAAIYGGMPARLSLQGDFLENFGSNLFPDRDIDWSIVTDSLSYPDNPNHEEGMPAFREAEAIYNAFWQRLENNAGIDLDGELAALRAELQLLFESVR